MPSWRPLDLKPNGRGFAPHGKTEPPKDDWGTAQAQSAHACAITRSKPPPGDWAFGARHQAITFVTRLDA
jgi:hypothetical protein